MDNHVLPRIHRSLWRQHPFRFGEFNVFIYVGVMFCHWYIGYVEMQPFANAE